MTFSRRQLLQSIPAAALLASGLTPRAARALATGGLRYLFVDDETLNEQGRLLAWCAIATVYLAGTVLWLNIDLRVNQDDHQFMRRTSRHPIVAVFSAVVTFSSSLVGLSAAVTVIVGPEDPDYFNLYDLVAVWAMLASWAMFHWGYSRIYYAAYQNREAEKPLVFPGTEHPRLEWSDRARASVRPKGWKGPDGFDTSAPLVSTGMVTPRFSSSVVATFSGGVKRYHGAFKWGGRSERQQS